MWESPSQHSSLRKLVTVLRRMFRERELKGYPILSSKWLKKNGNTLMANQGKVQATLASVATETQRRHFPYETRTETIIFSDLADFLIHPGVSDSGALDYAQHPAYLQPPLKTHPKSSHNHSRQKQVHMFLRALALFSWLMVPVPGMDEVSKRPGRP